MWSKKINIEQKVNNKNQLKFCTVTVVCVLLYGSGSWILINDEIKIDSADIKFLYDMKGCTREFRISNINCTRSEIF
jgi:hypothetical protein